jgi:hypothetical protein
LSHGFLYKRVSIPSCFVYRDCFALALQKHRFRMLAGKPSLLAPEPDDFIQSIRARSITVTWLVSGHFLTNSVQFTIRQSSTTELYRPVTDTNCAETHNKIFDIF